MSPPKTNIEEVYTIHCDLVTFTGTSISTEVDAKTQHRNMQHPPFHPVIHRMHNIIGNSHESILNVECYALPPNFSDIKTIDIEEAFDIS